MLVKNSQNDMELFSETVREFSVQTRLTNLQKKGSVHFCFTICSVFSFDSGIRDTASYKNIPDFQEKGKLFLLAVVSDSSIGRTIIIITIIMVQRISCRNYPLNI